VPWMERMLGKLLGCRLMFQVFSGHTGDYQTYFFQMVQKMGLPASFPGCTL